MKASLKIMAILSLIFAGDAFASKLAKCNFNSLQAEHFKKMEKKLQDFTKKGLDIWMKETNHEYDINIPTSIWVGFIEDTAYIDLLFGIKRGHLIGSHRIPDSLSHVDLGFKIENGKCLVFMKRREFESSGFILLFHKNSFNQSIGDLYLFEGNDPTLLSFSL